MTAVFVRPRLAVDEVSMVYCSVQHKRYTPIRRINWAIPQEVSSKGENVASLRLDSGPRPHLRLPKILAYSLYIRQMSFSESLFKGGTRGLFGAIG